MVRRARRQTPREAASLSRAIAKSLATEAAKDARKALAKSIQEFAIKSMNGLAQAGPAWTGEFSQSWVFVSENEPAQSLTAGGSIGIGKYGRQDAPLQKIESALKNKKYRFQIVNTSPHAAIAIDEEEAMFAPPKDQPDPIKVPVQYGIGRPDQEHPRWQIKDISNAGPDDEITSQITAERDWFTTYTKGGQLQKDLSDGVRLGFNGNSL